MGTEIEWHNCKIEYLAGRDNTCADLLPRKPEHLEAESVRVELGVDDRAYQTGVINLNRLKDCPVLKTDVEEATQVVTDPHWIEGIEKGQMDRAKVEAGETKTCIIHKGRPYYCSGRDKEVRLKLYVPKDLRSEILEQCHEKLGDIGIDVT